MQWMDSLNPFMDDGGVLDNDKWNMTWHKRHCFSIYLTLYTSNETSASTVKLWDLLETRSGSNYQLSDSSVGGLWLWWAETAAPGDTEYNVNTPDRRQEGRGDMLHCTMGDTCSATISPLRQPINYYKTNVLIMQLKLGRLDYQSAEWSFMCELNITMTSWCLLSDWFQTIHKLPREAEYRPYKLHHKQHWLQAVIALMPPPPNGYGLQTCHE